MQNFPSNVLIPRLEDLPYYLSPPIQFVFSQTANLASGKYTFPVVKALFTPDRPIQDNALYFFRTVSFSMDITEQDYLSAVDVSVTPFRFHCYEQSLSNAPRFREPLLVSQFLQNFDYKLLFLPKQEPNAILGSFEGTIEQTASLVGKASVTATATISAQEITHDGFIERFTKMPFPHSVNGGY